MALTNNTTARPIRVAHVSLGLDMGGMEKLLVEFARHADRTRFQLRFITLGSRGSLAAEVEASGWQVTALEEPPGLRPGLVFRLAQLFRRGHIDVVHTHNTKPLIYGGPAARLAGVPRVIHTRHGQRFRAALRATAAFRLASRTVDHLVCVSQDSADRSREEGIAAPRIATVRNGIDVARFAYAGPKISGPVVMVGRLSPEKDVATLIRAAAIAVRDFPPLRVEIVGDGPCREDLHRLTAGLGLGEQVSFLGEVRDIPSLLARASLFVLPSLTEGISLTLLEAMARGLPVVATRVGGNCEVVMTGETGVLVSPEAPHELAGAIVRLLSNPQEAHNLGVAGRKRVEQHFDVRQMVRGYEALYLQDAKNGSLAPKRRARRLSSALPTVPQ
jgi:glycosyltransferase involved in cell wall biosynthesis